MNKAMKTARDIMFLGGASLLMAACGSDNTTQNGDPQPTPTPAPITVKPEPVRIARAYNRFIITPGNSKIPAGVTLVGDHLLEHYAYAPAAPTETIGIASGHYMTNIYDIVTTPPSDIHGINTVFDADPGDVVTVTRSSGNIATPDTIFTNFPSADAMLQFRGRLTYNEANNFAYAANGKVWQRSNKAADTLALAPVKPAPVRLREEYRNMQVSPTANGDVNTISFMMANNKTKTLLTSALGDTKLKVFNSNYFISQSDTVSKAQRPADLPPQYSAFYSTRDDSLLLNKPSGKISTPDTLVSMYPMTNGQHWFTKPMTGAKAAMMMKSADGRTYKVF